MRAVELRVDAVERRRGRCCLLRLDPAPAQHPDGRHGCRRADAEQRHPDPLAPPFWQAARGEQSETEGERRARADQEPEGLRLEIEPLHWFSPWRIARKVCAAPGGNTVGRELCTHSILGIGGYHLG